MILKVTKETSRHFLFERLEFNEGMKLKIKNAAQKILTVRLRSWGDRSWNWWRSQTRHQKWVEDQWRPHLTRLSHHRKKVLTLKWHSGSHCHSHLWPKLHIWRLRGNTIWRQRICRRR